MILCCKLKNGLSKLVTKSQVATKSRLHCIHMHENKYQNIYWFFLSITEDGSSDILLNKGDTVIVIGNSQRRGYLVVEKHNHTIHVPFQYLELKRPI